MIPVLLLLAVVVFLLRPRSARRSPTRKPVELPEPTRGSGTKIECVNPANGELVGECFACTKEEVEQSVRAAREAQKEWAKTDFTERAALLQDLLDWVVNNQEQIVKWSTVDSGKTVTEAMMGEVVTTCEKFRWIIANGAKALKPDHRPVPLLLRFTKTARVEYHPLGVLGIIVPWNYPAHNVLSALAPALFAGNGAVCKVSEWASWSARGMETVVRTILAKRGHNPRLISIITGYGETGGALVKGGVDKIFFIGSPGTGARIMADAAPSLTPVILELGGKDPFIVFDDAQLDHVVAIAMTAAFFNCGQNCISAERFYVQAGIYDRFVKAVEERARKIRQGCSQSLDKPVTKDVGAITMPQQAKIVEELVDDAIKQGARVLWGGKRREEKEVKDGKYASRCTYYEPTIIVDVTHKMKIANEEAFGPVMTIIKFNTEEQVIAMANSTVYGLGSSVFTTDYSKATRVQKALEAGMVSINDFAMVPLVQSLPFGGLKRSGFGHFNGYEGLRGFSRIQSIVSDRFPLRVTPPTWIQFPVHPNSHLIAREAVFMIYGDSWIGSAKALFRMILLLSSKPKSPPSSPIPTESDTPSSPSPKSIKTASKKKSK